MAETVQDIIGSSTVKVLIIAFVLGGIYFEFKAVQKDVTVLETRLEKKIKVISSLEKRIRNLETCK